MDAQNEQQAAQSQPPTLDQLCADAQTIKNAVDGQPAMFDVIWNTWVSIAYRDFLPWAQG